MEAEAAAWSAVERVARDAYGRLVAMLAYRWNDIAAAEDAMADALAAALVRWPENGVPDSPEAWLVAAAKNRLREAARHQAVVDDAAPALVAMIERRDPPASSMSDRRLNLMFACAHPAIDEAVRTPLMLQAVLGLDSKRIAAAFVVPPATMAQRLVRAKQKIRDARVPFEAPDPADTSERLEPVLEGIYAAFGTGWHDAENPSSPGPGQSLASEALFLAHLLGELLPRQPEVLGLLALMKFSHARRNARFRDDGAFVPLATQDCARWDKVAIQEADALLLRAASHRTPGPFQLEAAIQSAHCQRLFSGVTPWRAIAMLYEALNHVAPTLASRVAHAAALVEIQREDEAIALLDQLATAADFDYQPYWVVYAHAARAKGQPRHARVCLLRALELTTAPSLRAYIQTCLAELEK